MALTARDIFEYSLIRQDDSKIGEKGCEFLSEADWPCLSVLGLNNTAICDKGVKYLSEANWPLLKILMLSCLCIRGVKQ